MTFYPSKPPGRLVDYTAENGGHAAIFEEETMESLRELGAVLGPIRERLISEGYAIKDGRIYKKHENEK